MNTQYAPRHFLRAAPNALLDRYFHGRDLLGDLDIQGLAETDIETLFQRWDGLPPERRSVVDSDFRLVHDLADEDGIRTLIDEGRYHGEDLEPIFAPMAGFYDKALWTLIERLQYAEVALRFRQADQFPSRYWLRRKDLPAVPARDDAATRSALAAAVSAYFRENEGRGYACVVDTYKRDDALYFFVYAEDYGRMDIGFDGPRLDRRHRRPAFEVVFLYDATQAALDVYCHSNRLVCKELQTIFARVVFGTDLGADHVNDRVYHLNRFKRRDVEFVFDPLSGIQSVALTSLRLSLFGGGSKRINVEADPSQSRHAVHDLLDDVLDTGRAERGGGKIPLALVNITRVGLRATFIAPSKRGRPTRTFFLAYPNGCTLKHDGKDALLRTMLIDSGIEPRARSANDPAA
jgi:hypothetical protein